MTPEAVALAGPSAELSVLLDGMSVQPEGAGFGRLDGEAAADGKDVAGEDAMYRGLLSRSRRSASTRRRSTSTRSATSCRRRSRVRRTRSVAVRTVISTTARQAAPQQVPRRARHTLPTRACARRPRLPRRRSRRRPRGRPTCTATRRPSNCCPPTTGRTGSGSSWRRTPTAVLGLVLKLLSAIGAQENDTADGDH